MTGHVYDLAGPKGFESDDPFELHGVVFSSDLETSRQMARCFVEEYALLGLPRQAVRRLFESPAFYGTRTLAQQHGWPFIEQLLDEVLGEKGAGDATGS